MNEPSQSEFQSFINHELEQVVSRVAAMLAADAPFAAPASVGGLAALAGAADARRDAARLRRELAMDLVAGALLNERNPAWDPRDPATCRAASDGTLLQAIG